MLHRDGNDATLTYFEHGEEFEKLNPGKTFEQLRLAGYNGYPAFNLKQRHHRACDDYPLAIVPTLMRIRPILGFQRP